MSGINQGLISKSQLQAEQGKCTQTHTLIHTQTNTSKGEKKKEHTNILYILQFTLLATFNRLLKAGNKRFFPIDKKKRVRAMKRKKKCLDNGMRVARLPCV